MSFLTDYLRILIPSGGMEAGEAMEGGNEQHLAILLRKFNEKMYLDCVLKTQDIIQSEPAIQARGLEVIKTPDKAGDLAFRTSFDFPLYIMLSHPICKFEIA